jgi:uncharacterized integral membrane protein
VPTIHEVPACYHCGVTDINNVPPAEPVQPGPPGSPADSDGAPSRPEAPSPLLPVTRTGVVWWALGFSLLLLILVLVFVLQNLTNARTSFFGLTWTIPLGLDLLLAALLGGVIAFLLGAARMLQIRRVARRYAGRKRP